MFTAVIISNILLSLACLWVARRVWQFRKSLARAADALEFAERRTHAVLYNAPNAIIKGQRGTRGLRQRYQLLTKQLRQVQRVLGILSLVLRIWQQQTRRRVKVVGNLGEPLRDLGEPLRDLGEPLRERKLVK